ncbi:MAG: hypothetical protein AAGG99_05595 [Pseudomonadota bacterium]
MTDQTSNPHEPPVQETGRTKRSRTWNELFTDAVLLRGVYWLLLGATLTFLVLDYRELVQMNSAAIPGDGAPQEPVVVEPAKQRDHLRPYLPFTQPIRRRGAKPNLPGLTEPPSSKQLAGTMRFVRGADGKATAIGRIRLGTAQRFAKFLEAQKGEIKQLYLHSPGGIVREALEMSQRIRGLGITTVVARNAYCASSCPLILAGGKERRVHRQSWTGVHQIYTGSPRDGTVADGLAQGQVATAQIMTHLTAMGIDLRLWTHALETPSRQLYVLTPKQLRTYKLATRITG